MDEALEALNCALECLYHAAEHHDDMEQHWRAIGGAYALIENAERLLRQAERPKEVAA